MNTKDDALKLALEALEECRRDPRLKYEHPYYDKTITAIREALAEQPAPPPECKTDAEKTAFAFGWWKALEENRKQPAQDREPCGWRMKHNGEWAYSFTEDAWDFIRRVPKAQQQEPVVWMYVNKSTHETKFQKHMRDFVDHSLWSEVPLYGEPLANHELQCVCGAVWLGDEMVHLPNKHPPASKPWVGLTDQEFQWIYDNGRTPAGMMELTEAKLREKNA